MKIQKRNGKIVDFDETKLSIVLDKAFSDFPDIEAKEVKKAKNSIISFIKEDVAAHQDEEDLFSVEDCQDSIQSLLRKLGYRKVANKFKEVREERAFNRELGVVFDALSNKDSEEKTDNANVNGYTPSGRHLHVSEEVIKLHSMREVFSKDVVKAVKRGDFYIHDRGWTGTGSLTCCQIDLEKLLKGGFSTGHGWLREPSNIKTAMLQAAIAIQSNQNDQHGGQSVFNFDLYMAPYLMKSYRKHILDQLYSFERYSGLNLNLDKDYIERYIKDPNVICDFTVEAGVEALHEWTPTIKAGLFKEIDLTQFYEPICQEAYNKTVEDTNQAAESIVHNLNSMASRAGSQVPFSSINFGLGTDQASRQVSISLLKAQLSGLGNHETPIFPILIYELKKGINFEKNDPNYDIFRLAMECSSKRLFPTYAFMDSSFNLPLFNQDPVTFKNVVAYMGCRTRLGTNCNGREGSGSRGNLSFNTINLPLLALDANGKIDKFYKLLKNTLELCDKALLERYELQCTFQKRNFPSLMGQGIWIDSDSLDDFDEVRPVLKHGSLSIGFVGLAECLKVLTGKHHGESKDSDKLGYEIIKYMRDYCDKRLKETSLNFSLLATPAETLCKTALEQTRKIYGVVPEVTDRAYFTNSMHVPVYYQITAKEKMKIEGKYHKLCNAGHIAYVEVDGDISQNLDAFEEILHIMSDSDVGYGAINIPIIECPICHHSFRGSSDIHICPNCSYDELIGIDINCDC